MKQYRVVIADSDPACRKTLKTMLQQAGYVVVGEAHDGLSTIKLIRNRQPDLVIMEDRLAMADGEEVATIVQEEALAPVILMTSYDQIQFSDRDKTLREYAYVIKPVSEQNLFPIIELVMRYYRRIRELEEEVARLKDMLETRKLVEKAKGILMETLGLSEAEAFRRIQKQSMDKRMSMKAVAKAIILAYELQAADEKDKKS
ncbi:MAG: two-component system, response regulator PdtaR [Eubacteriales bacterium]|nr:two-component system, response regulator PdtaR [Eubacteriales bacterium]MDN5363363.1 two-component system, response regulator PdtaR [Eubacteriales bacterium]